jgi:hypothetical protein
MKLKHVMWEVHQGMDPANLWDANVGNDESNPIHLGRKYLEAVICSNTMKKT